MCLMKRTRKYRVLDQTTGAYYWCYATLLQVDIGNPGQKKGDAGLAPGIG